MTITWAELVVLMSVGTGVEDRVAGVVREREIDPLPEDVTAEDVDGAIEQHPNLGRVLVREQSIRVSRRGELVRTETADGQVTAVFGVDTNWVFQQGEATPVAYPAGLSAFSWDGDAVGRRLQPSRWEGDDFTRLTSPIEETEWRGRAAWAVELAPPRHKPYPLQLVVDAATGIVLRQGNRDFGSVTEWIELDLDADLPDALFVWDGPSVSPERAHAELDFAHEQDLVRRRSWLDARGIAFDVGLRPELLLHDWTDETGAFIASIDTRFHGALGRWPVGDEPQEHGMNYRHTYRWSDTRWSWALGTDTPVADKQLAHLQARLAQST